MKSQLTKEQVLDALRENKSVQKAANALGIKYPEMQKYLRKYGIHEDAADVAKKSSIIDWIKKVCI